MWCRQHIQTCGADQRRWHCQHTWHSNETAETNGDQHTWHCHETAETNGDQHSVTGQQKPIHMALSQIVLTYLVGAVLPWTFRRFMDNQEPNTEEISVLSFCTLVELKNSEQNNVK